MINYYDYFIAIRARIFLLNKLFENSIERAKKKQWKRKIIIMMKTLYYFIIVKNEIARLVGKV